MNYNYNSIMTYMTVYVMFGEGTQLKINWFQVYELF
jgi:hypothetical protein